MRRWSSVGGNECKCCISDEITAAQLPVKNTTERNLCRQEDRTAQKNLFCGVGSVATLCDTNLPKFRTSQCDGADGGHFASLETAQRQWKQSQLGLSSSVSCSLQPPGAASCQPSLSGGGRDDARGNNNMFFFLPHPLYLDMLIFGTTPSSVIDIYVQRHNTPLPFLSPPRYA